ncbi:MAG: hypothetical protein KY394_03010 [Actinobacteria bacterium]|nr:hypothetical protein [Actinomycetota bacterium]
MAVIDWLLEGDPAIRWQVMRDLTDEPAGTVAGERRRVATEGWGAWLLSLQGDDGNWGGGPYSPKWISTTYTMLLLRHFGIDPDDPAVRAAVGRVREGVMMTKTKPFFTYAGETCVTAMALALSSYFRSGAANEGQVGHLLAQQREDGGWNCDTSSERSSFHTTISVLEALLELDRSEVGAGAPEARERGHDYLLQRRMFRSLSTGEPVNKRWTLFSFPPRWYYDVLRGLDYLREAEEPPDDRAEEAVTLVESKRDKEGQWLLQNPHRGREHFQMEEGAGKPSRWNTLRALRVLRWYSRYPRLDS